MQPTLNLSRCGSFLSSCFVLAAVLLFSLCARGDQIEMQNGDRYNGKVLSLTNDIMVLQSEILGTITIPRTKVAKISLGTATNAASSRRQTAVSTTPIPPSTNSAANSLASLRQPGAAGEAEKVKQQFLAEADPAAKAKFDAMLGDLLSGKMTVADLRVQAKSAADQLRALKKELGPEADPTLDGYLSVLESFLKEVPANDSLSVKTPSGSPKPAAEKEE